MRKRDFFTKMFAVAVIVFANFAIAELIAGALYYSHFEKVIWLKDANPSALSTQKISAIGASGLSLSPYFGYVNERDSSQNVSTKENNVVSIGAYEKPNGKFDCATESDPILCISNLSYWGIDWHPSHINPHFPDGFVNQCHEMKILL